MKILPSELNENGYRLFDKMSHESLMQFITPYLNKFNISTFAFIFFNMILLGGFLFLLVKSIMAGSVGLAVGFFVFGSIMAYGLIPLHEYMHGVAYKANGAKNVSYNVNFKKFMFLTIADKFVASKTEFLIIALAPFMVITLLASPLLLFASLNWQIFILGMLLTHTICCIGDFGLVSYFLSNSQKSIVTYDDKDLNETFFYSKDL